MPAIPNYQYAVIEDFERDEEDPIEPTSFVVGDLDNATKVRNELELLEYAFNENEDTLKSLIAKGRTISEAIEMLRKDFEEEFDPEEGYYVVGTVIVSEDSVELVGLVD